MNNINKYTQLELQPSLHEKWDRHDELQVMIIVTSHVHHTHYVRVGVCQ